MLYMLGTQTVDTRPFSIDTMERQADASIVCKPVIGALPPKEFTGEGEDEITLPDRFCRYGSAGLTSWRSPIRCGGLERAFR